MADQNTDNLAILENNSIDSPDNEAPKAADDFFEALDRKVNEGILEQEDKPAEMQSGQVEETSEMRPETNSQEHDWEKRYGDSSDEARRLNSRLGELEPYVPVLDAMRKDPNLVTHVRDYFEGGGSTPKKVTEKLGLDDDFIFDKEEVNGGACGSINSECDITVWRKEEILKVSIHELIHCLGYDYRNDTLVRTSGEYLFWILNTHNSTISSADFTY